MKGRVYLSGPMSGLPNLNFPAFNRAAVRLRNLRCEVVNPVEVYKEQPGDTWLDCIINDLAAMKGCTAICMLPGWTNSFGAKIERMVADKLGLDVFYLSDLVEEAA